MSDLNRMRIEMSLMLPAAMLCQPERAGRLPA